MCLTNLAASQTDFFISLTFIFYQFETESTRSRQGSASGSFLSTLHSPSVSAKLDTALPSFTIQTASLEEASETEKRRHKEKLFKAIIEGDIQLVS